MPRLSASLLSIGVIAGSFLVVCSAQNPPAAPSAPNATQAAADRGSEQLELALDALGGLPRLRQIKNVTRRLEGVGTDVGQGSAPTAVNPVVDRIGKSPPAFSRSRTTAVRDLQAQRSADDVRFEFFGGPIVSRKTVLSSADGFTAYSDYIYRSVRPTPTAALGRVRATAFRRYPESLLLTAWDRRSTARWLGRTTWEGRPHEIVAIVDVDGEQVSLYIDAATHRLSKFETLGEDGVLGDVVIEVVYDDYRPVGDLVLPFRYIDRRGGIVADDNRATSIEVDTVIADAMWQRPSGFAEVNFGKPFPTLEPLGDGVFAVLGGYNAIFVTFDDFVLVLEAGGSSREAQSVIEQIKRTAPDKPIRFVVATHWHFDHLSGMRPYIAEGATIVGPPSVLTVLETAAAARQTLNPDALSRNPQPLRFEPLRDAARTFSDGKHTVVVHNISPSPHAAEMLIAYLPKDKILFEADLLDIYVPGRAGPAGEGARDLAREIERLRLDVARIVPVHGQIGTIEDLQQSLTRGL